MFPEKPTARRPLLPTPLLKSAISSLFLAVIPLFLFAVAPWFMLAARQDFCGEGDIDG
jgi:hypothetical protein